MTARELDRILRRAFRRALPMVALCGCGSDPGQVTLPGSGGNWCEASVPISLAEIATLAPDSRGHAAPEKCAGPCGHDDVGDCWVVTRPLDASLLICTSADRNECAIEGRRPEGLGPFSLDARLSPAGRWLARAAWLEAASVSAFERLAEELRAHGATADLVRDAARAAADERVHARMTARLARRAGANPPPVRCAPFQPRELADLARENAIEGCVRETYGAMVARTQSRCARARPIRAAYARIAVDETRHAALGWRVDAWATKRLGAPERKLLRDARREAAAQLASEAAAPVEPELCDALGLPDATTSQRLVRELRAALWA